MTEKANSTKDSDKKLDNPEDTPKGGDKPEGTQPTSGKPELDKPKGQEPKTPTLEELQAEVKELEESGKNLQANRDQKDAELKQAQEQLTDALSLLQESRSQKPAPSKTGFTQEEYDRLIVEEKYYEAQKKLTESQVERAIKPFVEEQRKQKVRNFTDASEKFIEKYKDEGMSQERFSTLFREATGATTFDEAIKVVERGNPDQVLKLINALNIQGRLPEILAKKKELEAAEEQRKAKELADATVMKGGERPKMTAAQKSAAEKIKEGSRKFYEKVKT